MVIATMHRPSTAILNQFHKVLVLDHGGQMAYWGDVPGMMRYFRKAAADMAIDVSEEARTAGGADYVFEVLEAPLSWHDRRRRQHPRLWQERFEGYRFRNVMGHHHEGGAPRTLYEGSLEFPPPPGAASYSSGGFSASGPCALSWGACGAVWGCTPCCWKGRCWPC